MSVLAEDSASWYLWQRRRQRSQSSAAAAAKKGCENNTQLPFDTAAKEHFNLRFSSTGHGPLLTANFSPQ
jgi:hypothetical protein